MKRGSEASQPANIHKQPRLLSTPTQQDHLSFQAAAEQVILHGVASVLLDPERWRAMCPGLTLTPVSTPSAMKWPQSCANGHGSAAPDRTHQGSPRQQRQQHAQQEQAHNQRCPQDHQEQACHSQDQMHSQQEQQEQQGRQRQQEQQRQQRNSHDQQGVQVQPLKHQHQQAHDQPHRQHQQDQQGMGHLRVPPEDVSKPAVADQNVHRQHRSFDHETVPRGQCCSTLATDRTLPASSRKQHPLPQRDVALASIANHATTACSTLGSTAGTVPPATQLHQQYARHLCAHGYAICKDLLSDMQQLVHDLAEAVQNLHALGWNPLWLLMYDPPWLLACHIAAQLRLGLGPGLKLNPDFYVFLVDGSMGSAAQGWGPHRDRPTMGFLPNGMPMYVTAWLALTEANPCNGCMYVVLADQDPSYFGTGVDTCVEDLQAIRALPVPAGSVILWSGRLLHWGGRAQQQTEEDLGGEGHQAGMDVVTLEDHQNDGLNQQDDGMQRQSQHRRQQQQQQQQQQQEHQHLQHQHQCKNVHEHIHNPHPHQRPHQQQQQHAYSSSSSSRRLSPHPRISLAFALSHPDFEDPSERGVDLELMMSEGRLPSLEQRLQLVVTQLLLHEHQQPLVASPGLQQVVDAVEGYFGSSCGPEEK